MINLVFSVHDVTKLVLSKLVGVTQKHDQGLSRKKWHIELCTLNFAWNHINVHPCCVFVFLTKPNLKNLPIDTPLLFT